MTWWQIILVFAGIPAAVFTLVTLLVLQFATARVPDGIARAVEQRDHEDEASTIVDSGEGEN